MNIITEIVLVAAYFLIFAIIIKRWSFFKSAELPKNFLIYVFALKIFTGIILALIYTHFYPNRAEADIYKYFDDGKVMFGALKENPEDFFRMLTGTYGGRDHHFMHTYYYEMNNWYREYEGETFNDSHTIIRFNALAYVFSFGYYHVHTVFMCFLSLFGITALFKAFSSYFETKKILFALVLFLLPSILFWGSGVLKEGLLLFALGIFIYGIIEIFKFNHHWMNYAFVIFSVFILLFLKIYALLLLIPCIVAFLINKKYSVKWQWITYFICISGSVIIAINSSLFIGDLNILETIATKQHDFINHAKELGSKSVLNINPVEPSLISFLVQSPLALFNTISRPFVFESANPLMIMAGIENLILLILIFLAVFKRDSLSHSQKNLFYLLIFYSVMIFTLVGLVTPVMGAMVRYKVPALGMMAAAFILLGNWKVLLNNYPKLKKLLKIEN